jgi:hypothetical protein
MPVAPKSAVILYYYSAENRVCPEGVRVEATGFDMGTLFYVMPPSPPFSQPVVDSTMTRPTQIPATFEEAISADYRRVHLVGHYRHNQLAAMGGSGTYIFRCRGPVVRPDATVSFSWGRELVSFITIVAEDPASPSGLRVEQRRH